MSERSVADGAQMPAPASDERPEDGLGGQLTVVLLTFNCAHRIAGVLARLAALQVPVVVVDNGSGDDIREVLARFPDVDAVLLPQHRRRRPQRRPTPGVDALRGLLRRRRLV